MIETGEASAMATILDAEALDHVVGGDKVYTGGRFQLEIGNYSVGYPAPPPPPPPPTRP